MLNILGFFLCKIIIEKYPAAAAATVVVSVNELMYVPHTAA